MDNTKKGVGNLEKNKTEQIPTFSEAETKLILYQISQQMNEPQQHHTNHLTNKVMYIINPTRPATQQVDPPHGCTP